MPALPLPLLAGSISRPLVPNVLLKIETCLCQVSGGAYNRLYIEI